MTTIRDNLLYTVDEIPTMDCNKISIIGAGNVGMACAICILNKKISNEICLIDKDEKKVLGETLDLRHAASYINDAKIIGGTDMALTECSRIYIINAGVHMKDGESNLDLLNRNAAVIKGIVSDIVDLSPESVILMVTDPVDVLTYLAWKLSGFPKYRVLGSGTSLDSSRFRFLVSERLQVPPSSCDTYVIGEHGESCVPVWSSVAVSGVNLREIDKCIGVDANDDKGWNNVHQEIVDGTTKVKNLKGCSNWAIALSCAAITEAILKNTGAIMPVSTDIKVVHNWCLNQIDFRFFKGLYEVEEDVFLSMPCALNATGVTSIVKLNLTEHECDLLQKSIKVVIDAQKRLAMLLTL